MTEASQIYRVSARCMRPYGRWERVENRLEAGWPDVYHHLRGADAGWVECKIFDAPGRPRRLTLAQVRWGRDEVRWGGRWHLLGLLFSTWVLYDIAGAEALFRGDTSSTPLLSRSGPFPTPALLDLLAPRDRT